MHGLELSRAVFGVVAISLLLAAVAEAGVEIELMNPIVHGRDGVNEATPDRVQDLFFNRLWPDIGPLDDTDYTEYAPWFLGGGTESYGFRTSEFQLEDVMVYDVLNFDPTAGGFAQVHLVPFGYSVEDPNEVIYFDVLESVLQATGNQASLITPKLDTGVGSSHANVTKQGQIGLGCRWNSPAARRRSPRAPCRPCSGTTSR